MRGLGIFHPFCPSDQRSDVLDSLLLDICPSVFGLSFQCSYACKLNDKEPSVYSNTRNAKQCIPQTKKKKTGMNLLKCTHQLLYILLERNYSILKVS